MDRAKRRSGGREDSSGNRTPILAFLNHTLHRAQDGLADAPDETRIHGDTLVALEKEIEQLVHDDADTDRRIRELVMALKPVPIEPDRALYLRAMIRPFITFSLTFAFIAFMVVWVLGAWWFGEQLGAKVINNLKEMLPVFLGIYGSVIGFWFGEHTAQRSQEKH